MSETCEYSGLGVIDDWWLPNDRVIRARCTCSALVTVVDGRIPFHATGVNEAP